MRKFSREPKKVVVKVGSSSITHENGIINLQKIDELCFELANMKNHGRDVVLVSSGAIENPKIWFEAELGISTQKLHARGPVGIKELISTKYIIFGKGQVRE